MSESQDGAAFGDDELIFADEEAAAKPRGKQKPWRILVADDEEEVHKVTRMVLGEFSFMGKGMELLSAYSAAEAKSMLRTRDDVAVILLDVVMETDDAGLQVAKYIRDELKNANVRIVLRTGQPGHAPEEQVILQYDINDYKAKTELTVTRLITTVVAALRAYRDLCTLELNKKGLETILRSSAQIFEIRAVEKFSQGVLTQLTSLLRLDESALYCKASGFAAHPDEGEFRIFAGTGDFESSLHKPVTDVIPSDVLNKLHRALDAKHEVYLENGQYVGYFRSDNGSENLLYLSGLLDTFNEWDRYLLEVFCANVAIAFDNISLNNEIRETQRDFVFKLGEFVERRSRETGNHVRRVAEYSVLLGAKLGLSPEQLQILRVASPMHDVGKVGIPDAILNKPGKLDPDEIAVIRTHTTVGYEMFCDSPKELLQSAAVIAHQHHEFWDGGGYPQGISGEGIHIYGRITSVADVFDALAVRRVYKEPWPLEKIVDYFREQRGKQFDPSIVDLLLRDLKDFVEVQRAYPDVPEEAA